MAKIYKRLAKKPGIWRVDGIGPIENHGRLGTRAVVYLSGLNEDGLTHPYKGSSLNGKVLKHSVHSASLKDFRVGSVWKEGKRVSGLDIVVEPYTIDASRMQIVSLNYAVQVDERLWADTVLPETYFTMGENRSHLSPTLYALVPVLNAPRTRWLITPVSELLSFYAGISSPLLSSVLQGQLGNYVDWSKCRLSGDCVTLHVKRPITHKEAFVLARIVASPIAKEAFLGVHKHLALTQANNVNLPESARRPLLIKTGFPFNDQTTLQVLGKRMPILKRKNGPEIWAIFAMEICSCSHPFDFSKIVLENEEVVSGGKSSGGPGSPPPRFTPLRKDDEDDDDYELDDLPADIRLGRLAIRNYTNQFPGFGDIVFENQSPHSYQPGAGSRVNIDVPVDSFTVEGGSSSGAAKGNLGVDSHEVQLTNPNREISLFLDMLRQMRAATKEMRWKIVTRKLDSGLIQKGEFIALFPDKIANCRTWHKIEVEGGGFRPRQVVWAEVMPGIDSFYFYLLEMELKASENGQCTILLYNKDYSKMEDITFKRLLFLTAIKNRWPSPHNTWETYKQKHTANALFSQVTMLRINHPKKPGVGIKVTPSAWSQSILDKIEEIGLI